MAMSPKELKKEKIPECDLSNLSIIVIDDLSNDIIIHDTQNAEIPESPKQSTTQSIKSQEHTRAKDYPIVIPESQQNKGKKEPPFPTVKINENVKQEHKEDDIDLFNSGINVQLQSIHIYI